MFGVLVVGEGRGAKLTAGTHPVFHERGQYCLITLPQDTFSRRRLRRRDRRTFEEAVSHCRTLVLGAGISPEQLSYELCRRVIDTAPLCREVMLETAVHCLRQCGVPLWRRGVVIYDPDGIGGVIPERFLPYAATIRVVTDRPGAYDRVVRHLLQEYGAPLIVTDDRRSLGEGLMVVAAGAVRGDLNTPLPVFAVGDTPYRGTVGGYELDLAGFTPPDGVDEAQFLAAAWRSEGIMQAVRPAVAMQLGGRRIQVAEMAKLLDRSHFET